VDDPLPVQLRDGASDRDREREELEHREGRAQERSEGLPREVLEDQRRESLQGLERQRREDGRGRQRAPDLVLVPEALQLPRSAPAWIQGLEDHAPAVALTDGTPQRDALVVRDGLDRRVVASIRGDREVTSPGLHA